MAEMGYPFTDRHIRRWYSRGTPAMPQAPVRTSAQRRRGPAESLVPRHLTPDTGVMRWDDAVDRFLGEARRRNRSAMTIENYRQYLAGGRTKAFLVDYDISSPTDLGPAELK